jgi:hypothetical protein
MKKKIGVRLTDGSYVETVWYDDSYDTYHSGTRIGSARTLQEAIAVVEVMPRGSRLLVWRGRMCASRR